VKNVPGLVLHLLLGGAVGYMRDLGWQLREEVAQRTAAQEALCTSERQYRALVDSMHDIVFRADADLRLHFLNPAWERITGLSAEESLGRSLLDFVVEEDRAGVADLLGTLDRDGVPFVHREFCLRTASGALRWAELHASTRPDEPSFLFGTLTDITDSVRFEAEREARLQTEELLRAKNVLFTTIGHEFRTPLTGILGFADLLAEETEAPHRDWAQSIAENGQRLQHTLTSILDLAMLEANEVAPEPAPTNLSEVVQEATDRFASRAVERGLDLRLTLPPEPPQGSVDAHLLHRVLLGLLDNALKFTHRGHVDVALTATAEDFSIAVTDTGIGIPPDYLPHLFQDFRQREEGLTRPYEGNGLGLSVTKRLVDLMGGTIDVASTLHEGSTFTVRLPLHTHLPAAHLPGGVPPRPSPAASVAPHRYSASAIGRATSSTVGHPPGHA
jgi:PAS domain S-box-containing protein